MVKLLRDIRQLYGILYIINSPKPKDLVKFLKYIGMGCSMVSLVPWIVLKYTLNCLIGLRGHYYNKIDGKAATLKFEAFYYNYPYFFHWFTRRCVTNN